MVGGPCDGMSAYIDTYTTTYTNMPLFAHRQVDGRTPSRHNVDKAGPIQASAQLTSVLTGAASRRRCMFLICPCPGDNRILFW